MNELAVVPEGPQIAAGKGLVLYAVTSPLTKRAYGQALDEFLTWHQAEQPGQLSKGSRPAIPGQTPMPRPRGEFDQQVSVRDPEAGDRSCG